MLRQYNYECKMLEERAQLQRKGLATVPLLWAFQDMWGDAPWETESWTRRADPVILFLRTEASAQDTI